MPVPRRLALFRVAVFGAIAAAVAVSFFVRWEGPVQAPIAAPSPQLLAQGPQPTAPAYQMPDRLPLTLPVSPLMPATAPVSVSLTALNNLGQQYDQLRPMLRQHLSWPGSRPPEPKPLDLLPEPTTQQAV